MKVPNISLTVLALAGALAVGSSALAQTNTNAPAMRRPQNARGLAVDAQLTRLSEQLKLTEAQKPKVKAILEDENKKRQELRGDSALSQEDRRAKMQQIRQDSSKKMKEILTPDQFKQYEEYLQQQRNRRNQGGANGAAQ